MRTQQGSLFQSHGAWYVRFREQAEQADGSIKWVQRAQRLVSVTDYPKKSEVIPLRNELMARLNKAGFTLEAGVSPRSSHESARTRSPGQSDSGDSAPRRCQHNAEELHQDGPESGD